MNILGVEVEKIKGEKYVLLRLRYKRGLFFRIKEMIKDHINILNFDLKESNNVVCPECGKELDYFQEIVHIRRFKVNSGTGIISSKAKKIDLTYELDGDHDGFVCSDPYCGWEYEYFPLESQGKDMREEIKRIIKEEKLKIDSE